MNIYFLLIDYELRLAKSFLEKEYISSMMIAEYANF